MLFNSYEFLYLFLPVTLLGFFVLSKVHWFRVAAAWLALVSVFFYGYWSPRFVFLLLGSIAFNYTAGRAIMRAQAQHHTSLAKGVLVFALVANLGAVLSVPFFVSSMCGHPFQPGAASIVLPIRIVHSDRVPRRHVSAQGADRDWCATPCSSPSFTLDRRGQCCITAEMMPQFAREETYRFRLDNFLIGTGFLLIGLFKKVVLADGIQPYVGPVFEADAGYALTALEAWGGVLAYTLQLYFDFSGYSDMAIGLSKMLNIDLPLNFNSPYKATNIADFWRRWHMTLSRFLRDYLYIPLGGNRHGPTRRYMNLLITMLLGGLWHGAGWTFVIWGALHGVYLMVHQLWLAVRRWLGHDLDRTTRAGTAIAVGITFLSAVVAWVFFALPASTPRGSCCRAWQRSMAW
jgi:D-alanyl-lipoteichoic acid acyltransferase DltB (MBOAT superfamily)